MTRQSPAVGAGLLSDYRRNQRTLAVIGRAAVPETGGLSEPASVSTRVTVSGVVITPSAVHP